MLKRICDMCGKEIDTTNEYSIIEIQIRKGCSALGPADKYDLCYNCTHHLLRQVGEDNEDLGR